MARRYGGVFHDWIDGPWEQARGFLKTELEQLRVALNHAIVDLSDDTQVEGRVDYDNLPEAVSAPSVIGAIEDGDFQELPLGPGLIVGPGGSLGVNLGALPRNTGPEGERGPRGPVGPVGLTGIAGTAGPPGRRGSDGDSGRKIIMLQPTSTTEEAASAGHLHGLMRVLGDGATTTFNLLDLAEYLEHVGVNGSFQDPLTFSLSADQSQIVFDAAPGAAQVVTLEYVIANA